MGLAFGVLGLLASNQSLRGQAGFQGGFEKRTKSLYRGFSALTLRTLRLCVIFFLLLPASLHRYFFTSLHSQTAVAADSFGLDAFHNAMYGSNSFIIF